MHLSKREKDNGSSGYSYCTIYWNSLFGSQPIVQRAFASRLLVYYNVSSIGITYY